MAISQDDPMAVFDVFLTRVVSYAKWHEHGVGSTAKAE